MSLTFAREFARGLDRLGYLQIGYSRGTIPTGGGTSLRGWCLSFQRVSAASESGGTGLTKVWAPVSVLAEQRGGRRVRLGARPNLA